MITQLQTRSAIALAAIMGLGLVAASQLAEARGKPGPAPTQILPTSLGTPANCSNGYAVALNTATLASPLQAGGLGMGCSPGSPRPVLWSASTGMIDLVIADNLASSTLGSTSGVSDNGTSVGELNGGSTPFVRPLGGPLQALPPLSGMAYGGANAISANGQFIAGFNQTSTYSDNRAVLWALESGVWVAHDLGPGGAVAVDNNGTVVGNRPLTNTTATGWVQPLNGARLDLGGSDTRVHDISPSGKVIVGFRWKPTTRDPSVLYAVPVVWKQTSGNWAISDLQALDGVDSEAMGAGEKNGRAIIVGYGFTKKDAIQRAVAWIPDSNGNYAAPIRLDALAGRSRAWAEARDVNSDGQVVGTSAGSGLTYYPVLWTLP